MRIYKLYLASHVATSLMTAALIGIGLHSFNAVWFQAIAWPLVILLPMGIGVLMARRASVAVRGMHHLVASNDAKATTGIWEFEDQTTPLKELGQRWAQLTQANSRDIDMLIRQISHAMGSEQVPRANQYGHQLRTLLASLAQNAEGNLQQMLQATQEIADATQEIASGGEDQSESVSRTTTYAEQMSTNIDEIATNASAAHSAVMDARDSSSQALSLVRELNDGMGRIRGQVEVSERKLQALGEHSNMIGSIVETISAISSRTDMLALNASIESVRAGEHGRGFAVVADEVRKLAEQAAQATQEVAGLVDSIRLETQESIHVMAEEHTQLQAEFERVRAAADAMERITKISQDSADRVGEISQAAQQQLHLMNELVLAVERISQVAKASRKRAENAQWSTQNLTKSAQSVNASIAPLRDPSDNTTAWTGDDALLNSNTSVDASAPWPHAGETDTSMEHELVPSGS